MYNYIGILNKSSAVTKAVTCNFLNRDKPNLILAKGNIIEIYNINNEGLESTPYLNVYGKIILLEKIPAEIGSSSTTTSSSSSGDNLFLLTEDLDFAIISYNKSRNEIVNIDKGSVKEDIGKRQDKIHAVFEANFEYVVISAYRNIFKVVFLKNRNKNEDFSIRYEYEDLILLFPFYNEEFSERSTSSNIFAQQPPVSETSLNPIIPKFTVIKKDQGNTSRVTNLNITQEKSQNFNKNSQFSQQLFGIIKVNNLYNTTNNSESKSVKLETFNFNTNKQEVNKEVTQGLDLSSNPTCSLVISPKVGGIVIFFSNCLKYYSYNNSSDQMSMSMSIASKLKERETKVYSDRKFTTYCEIDKFRYLVVDEFGNLFLLAFKIKNDMNNNFNNNLNNIQQNNPHAQSNSYSIIFQFLGEVNYASTITYLDNNYIFIGSEKANSQLLKITKTPTNNVKRPFLALVEEYENLAPISDFSILNSQSEEGNTEILCVSGDDKSCSLKTIRKGTSINSEAEITLSGVISLFSVIFRNKNENQDRMLIDTEYENNSSDKNSLIFLNYIDHTRILKLDFTSYSISNYFHDNLSLIFKEKSLYAENFIFDNNYILHVSENYITCYDESLEIIFQQITRVSPVLLKFKKKKGMLYIYNKNNILLRHDIFKLINISKEAKNNLTTSSSQCNVDEVEPEFLLYEVLISSFNISDDLMIFSQWNINKLFIFSLKTRKTQVLCEFDDQVFCSSIAFLKYEGIKFLLAALSNGKLLYYKIKSKSTTNF
jgi:hypothetical protein